MSTAKNGHSTSAKLGHLNSALTLACIDGEYVMHISLADAQTPIKWEEAGWAPPAPQLPSLEMIFDYPVEEFIQKVMSQHYIISYGDNRALLENLCNILKVKVI